MNPLWNPIDLQLFGDGESEGTVSPESAEAFIPEEDFSEISVEADTPEDTVIAEALARADRRADLERQAARVRERIPTFDLARELSNPMFEGMTSLGMSVEDAYCALHHKELLEAAVREATQKTAEKIAGAIRSGSRRPSESGGSSQAPSVSAFDYSKASKAQREAFKKDLLARMARGEKVYPVR